MGFRKIAILMAGSLCAAQFEVGHEHLRGRNHDRGQRQHRLCGAEEAHLDTETRAPAYTDI